MNNEKCIEISTNHLLALCEIFEDYKTFYEDLEELIKSKTNKDLVSKVYDYIQKNKFSFPNKKYDTFIKKHQHTIESMKKYNCLSDFTVLSYDAKGEKRKNLPADYFYKYIEKHREDFETIKNVVLKIEDLGIDRITFGEHLDFTKKTFELNTSYDCEFAFLENMEVVSIYLKSSIKYKSINSLYCIFLEPIHHYHTELDEIRKYGRKIELSSLTFNPDKLPNDITTESTIEVIKGLAEKKKEEYVGIRNSVDLSISTSNLKKEFESLRKTYEQVDKLKDNQEVKNILLEMQNVIAKLQVFEENFEQDVIDTHSEISEDITKKQKSIESDRNFWDNIKVN